MDYEIKGIPCGDQFKALRLKVMLNVPLVHFNPSMFFLSDE